jgi:hypothetical protein
MGGVILAQARIQVFLFPSPPDSGFRWNEWQVLQHWFRIRGLIFHLYLG